MKRRSAQFSLREQIRYILGPNVAGQCYAASEAYYHLVGGNISGLTPIQGIWEDVSHWALKAKDGWIIDLTVEQFTTIPDYKLFRGRGFLTKKPSKNTQIIMDLVTGK